jgi:predicted nucleotidyltransferase
MNMNHNCDLGAVSEQIPRAVLRAWGRANPGVVAINVFGSRARGKARADSDLDLAFELEAS